MKFLLSEKVKLNWDLMYHVFDEQCKVSGYCCRFDENYPGMIQIMTTQTSKYFDFSENISSKTVNLSGKDQQKSMKVKIEKGVAGCLDLGII